MPECNQPNIYTYKHTNYGHTRTHEYTNERIQHARTRNTIIQEDKNTIIHIHKDTQTQTYKDTIKYKHTIIQTYKHKHKQTMATQQHELHTYKHANIH